MGRSYKNIHPHGAVQEEIFELLDPRRLYDWHTRAHKAINVLLAAPEDELAGGQRMAGKLFRGWAEVMLPEWGIYCTMARLDPETGKPVHRLVGLMGPEVAAVHAARKRFGKGCELYHHYLFRDGFDDHERRFGPAVERSEAVVLVREPHGKRGRIHTYLVSTHRGEARQYRPRLVDAKVPELRLNLRNLRSSLALNPQLKFSRGKGGLNISQRPYGRWIAHFKFYQAGGLRSLRPGWSFELTTWREVMASIMGGQRLIRGAQAGRYGCYPWLPLRYGWG